MNRGLPWGEGRQGHRHDDSVSQEDHTRKRGFVRVVHPSYRKGVKSHPYTK